ncbi:MAG: hypothetical protein ABW147_19505 [Candidatus Thiodiazotropha sp.]
MMNKHTNLEIPGAGDAVAVISGLVEAGKAAKEFLDGEILNVQISNEYFDSVELMAYKTGDTAHSARAILPPASIKANTTGYGMFRVNQLTASKSSFQFKISDVDHYGDNHIDLVINYNWKSAEELQVTARIDDYYANTHTFRKGYLTVKELGIKVGMLATGIYLQITIQKTPKIQRH